MVIGMHRAQTSRVRSFTGFGHSRYRNARLSHWFTSADSRRASDLERTEPGIPGNDRRPEIPGSVVPRSDARLLSAKVNQWLNLAFRYREWPNPGFPICTQVRCMPRWYGWGCGYGVGDGVKRYMHHTHWHPSQLFETESIIFLF
jgi:hypothetical protein